MQVYQKPRNAFLETFAKDREREIEREAIMRRIKVDDLIARKANWENRMNGVIENTNIRRKAEEMRKQAKEKLNERRARLARLFFEEQQNYETELRGRPETYEEKNEKIKQRALALRAENDEIRQKFVAECYERQFKDSCDELRTKTSKVRCWRIAHEGRRKQLEEKKQREEQEKKEEEYWADVWDKDRLRKVERELQDVNAIIELNKETKRLLDIQVRDHELIGAESNAQLQREREQLHKQWEWEEQEAERQAYELAKRLERERAIIVEYNNGLLDRKKREMLEEKANDRALINNLLAKEANDIANERREAERIRRECTEYQEQLKIQMARDKENFVNRDKFIEEVNKQVQAKEDAEWERQRLYRENLLKNVLAERHIQCEEKSAAKEYEKVQKKIYGEELDRKVAREEAEEMEKQRRIREMNIQNQQLLMRQMRYNKDRDERDRQYELALAKRMEKEEEIYAAEQERILGEDIPEDPYYGIKEANFYT